MEMQKNDIRTELDLLGTLNSNKTFGTFSSAIDKAGLKESLGGAGQHTLFAPTDEAFSKLPAGTLDRLFQPENKEELAALVNYHVVNGRKTAVDVGRWDAARTVNGQPAPIVFTSDKLSIDGARVTSPDILASNGVIHGIDKVNIPTKQ